MTRSSQAGEIFLLYAVSHRTLCVWNTKSRPTESFRRSSSSCSWSSNWWGDMDKLATLGTTERMPMIASQFAYNLIAISTKAENTPWGWMPWARSLDLYCKRMIEGLIASNTAARSLMLWSMILDPRWPKRWTPLTLWSTCHCRAVHASNPRFLSHVSKLHFGVWNDQQLGRFELCHISWFVLYINKPIRTFSDWWMVAASWLANIEWHNALQNTLPTWGTTVCLDIVTSPPLKVH